MADYYIQVRNDEGEIIEEGQFGERGIAQLNNALGDASHYLSTHINSDDDSVTSIAKERKEYIDALKQIIDAADQ